MDRAVPNAAFMQSNGGKRTVSSYVIKGYEMIKSAVWPALLALGLATAAQAAQAVPVIPGAAGFGMSTPAGRGGEIYKVTNLNDSGSGSLRACVEASGPRVCVFEVSGAIQLQKDLRIQNPYITIAGQTAPSPGISLYGGTVRIYDTHDVLIQHIRIRVGDANGGSDPINRDALDLAGGSGVNNVVLDHVSASWALDEMVSVWKGRNVTIRNSIISEALDEHRFAYSDGNVGKGPIVGPGTNNVLFSGNLLAHNRARNVRSKSDGLVFANNVVYDYAYFGTDIGEGSSSSRTSIVGNAYVHGPAYDGASAINIRGNLASGSRIFIEDNIAPGGNSNNPWSIVKNGASFNPRVNTAPIWPEGFTALPASQVQSYVAAKAGARPVDRDEVDARVVRDLQNRTGGLINSPSEVGGFPNLERNTRRLTLPERPHADDDGDGYTNLEEWLHGYARQVEGSGGDSVAPQAPKGLRVE